MQDLCQAIHVTQSDTAARVHIRDPYYDVLGKQTTLGPVNDGELLADIQLCALSDGFCERHARVLNVSSVECT